jgi:hypothetical protein
LTERCASRSTAPARATRRVDQLASQATGDIRESYLRFNVPLGQTFRSAKLRFFARLEHPSLPSVGIRGKSSEGVRFLLRFIV